MNRSAIVLLSALLCILYGTLAGAASFVLDPAGSTIEFTFVQAGAKSSGMFRKFDVRLALDDNAPASNRLVVTIPVASLDTGDEERDAVLRGAELFDVASHPTATFTSTSVRRVDRGRYEALGELSIRGVTRKVRVPFMLERDRMAGTVTIRRLDFGVGQGEWQTTEWVGNEVEVRFSLRFR